MVALRHCPALNVSRAPDSQRILEFFVCIAIYLGSANFGALVDKDLPALDAGEGKDAVLIPRVVGKDSPHAPLILGPHGDQGAALVNQWTTEEDESDLYQAVNEGSVLVPPGLLARVHRQIAIRYGGRDDQECLHFGSIDSGCGECRMY